MIRHKVSSALQIFSRKNECDSRDVFAPCEYLEAVAKHGGAVQVGELFIAPAHAGTRPGGNDDHAQ